MTAHNRPRIAVRTVELQFLRHADAGDPLVWDGPDPLRPLSDKGRRQAERLGAFLASAAVRPDLLLTSPLARAAETAQIVGEALGLPVRVEDRLAGGVDLEVIEAILGTVGDPDRPMLVGHDPDFSELLSLLTGAGAIPMRKGALARVDAPRPVRAGTGTLRWLLPPELLKHGH